MVDLQQSYYAFGARLNFGGFYMAKGLGEKADKELKKPGK
jgi:hypothetical protein